MTKIVRAFIAHSKAASDGYLADAKDRIRAILEAKAAGRATIEIVLGREDFDAHFKAAGSWDAWCRDVAFRVDYRTREIMNTLVVVPDRLVGAATAKIVEACLAVKRPVFAFFGDGNGLGGNEADALVPIVAIRQIADDYKAGWEIITEIK